MGSGASSGNRDTAKIKSKKIALSILKKAVESSSDLLYLYGASEETFRREMLYHVGFELMARGELARGYRLMQGGRQQLNSSMCTYIMAEYLVSLHDVRDHARIVEYLTDECDERNMRSTGNIYRMAKLAFCYATGTCVATDNHAAYIRYSNLAFTYVSLEKSHKAPASIAIAAYIAGMMPV